MGFTLDLHHIDWTATGILVTVIVVLVQTFFGIRKEDLKKITDAITALGDKLERFENRILRLEEWRVNVDKQLGESQSIHKDIALSLIEIRDSTARLERADEMRADEVPKRGKRR